MEKQYLTYKVLVRMKWVKVYKTPSTSAYYKQPRVAVVKIFFILNVNNTMLIEQLAVGTEPSF